tara:strand:+ start:375 stop:980 length:606 start_codon:yes stop_codon:yes gene_type:complete
MKKSRIAIIGAGKHAMMLKQLIVSQGYRFVGFFDEKKNKNKNKFILGNLTDLSLNNKKIDFLLLGLGDNSLRGYIFDKLKKKNYKFLTFVHSSVKVCKSAKIKEGSVVLMGAIINSNSVIDEACIINSGSIIEHDCHIKFSSHICPGVYLAGNVSVGKYSMIGIGSRVIQNIKILDKVIVGAGSIVLKNINKSLIVKGIYS